nr:MAG TPA: hypothetical protein [Caudoviricetes sp.]DAO77610.1 MAG TPA: hypothetical protein [Caudoviricetes sp.]DAZ59630.1 MAG TPA: hypothetical protein [Caudoviricetes sp.]
MSIDSMLDMFLSIDFSSERFLMLFKLLNL